MGMSVSRRIVPAQYRRTPPAPAKKEQAKAVSRPVPGPAPQTAHKRIAEKLKQLFGLSIIDNTSGKHGSIEGFLNGIAGPGGRIDIDSSFFGQSFRSRLAKLLGLPEKLITEQALNAMFGNQSSDGSLDQNDYLSDLGAFEKRLDDLIPIFRTKANAGETIWAFMRKTNIRIMNIEEGVRIFKGAAYRSAFAGMARGNDALFSACFKAALNVYIYPGGQFSTARAQEVSRFYTQKTGFKSSWNGSMSDKLLAFVLAAFESRFDLQLQVSKIKVDDGIKWDKKDSRGESVSQKFMRGVFADYVCGYGKNGENDHSILPEEKGRPKYDEINEESINAIAQRRGSRSFAPPVQNGLTLPIKSA